ncbi:WD40-repeat-containing domain protein, partial [Dimargaris cristalligena]
VSSLAIERIESRYLLAGSGNGSLHLYDLDEGVGDDPHSSGSGGGGGLSSAPPTAPRTITPLGEIPRPAGHAYTVSDVHWYPFDTGLFTTSSFDTTLKVWDTSALQAACTFHLQDKVLSHTLSSVAPGTNPYAHCLIAAATTNPLVRLCDLQSGAFTQTLTGHVGPVISCQWSPRHAHLLATGGTDGAVRLWDIRRASSCLMELNCRQSQSEYQGRAHQGMVNGLNFTEDGFYLVTVGSDQCIRLWDAATGDLLPV